MCFYNYGKIRYKIAKRDIVCYKRLYYEDKEDGSIQLKSEYKRYKYKLGKLNKPIELKARKALLTKTDYQIHEGYHSYPNIVWGSNFLKHKVYKCIIPKGTRYAQSNAGFSESAYVSENIIIQEEVTINKN